MSNEIKLTVKQITNRSLILPEYFTIRDLKKQLEGLGYKLDNVQVTVWHTGEVLPVVASDNIYITNGDHVAVVTKDSFDAVKAIEEEAKSRAEEAWEDEYMEEHISIKIFA